MATPPAFVAAYTSASHTTTGTPKTATVTNAVDDILIAVAFGYGITVTVTAPTGGSGLSWSTIQFDTGSADRCPIYVFGCKATAANTAVSLSMAQTAGTEHAWGWTAFRISGGDAIGASAKNVLAGADSVPTINLTTTAANSMIVLVNDDFREQGSAGTFTNTGAGARTSVGYYTLGDYWEGYHADAGAAGAKTMGMSAPTLQKWTMIAVEIKPAVITPGRNPDDRRRHTRPLLVR